MRKIYLFLFTALLFLGVKAQNNNTTHPDSLPISRRIFKLGEVKVTGKNGNANSTVNSEQIESFNKLDVAQALNLLPGVTLSSVGARNESVVFVRGFDLRQVPVFIDGIPIYVPYDGYVDLARFTTFDVSTISVEKGFSSIAYGANTMGGAINIISRKPVKQFEMDARSGWLSGQGHRLNLNVGSRIGKFYVQGSASQLKQNGFPLSDDFKPKQYEDGGKRDNAFREDSKYTFKVGFTPKGDDEYALSYVNQKGEKGNPPYVGDDPLQKARFWQWPYWNKESLYFISTTGINAKSAIKTRLFYDKFSNLLSAFDDNTYTTQKKASSFQSFYNDDTYGGALEYNIQPDTKHSLKASAQLKTDRHKEYNLGEPVRTFRDYTASVGVEDAYTVTDKLSLLPGISINLRHSLQAQNYNSTTKEVTNLPENENYAFNAQLGAVYRLNASNRISLSVARKSRFATIKDRYSYRMGAAIPNPDLKSETAMHFDAGYTGRFFDKLEIETGLFYSRLSDAIQQVNNVQPNIYQLQNTGKARFYGAELSLNYAVLKGWAAGGQYSYIHRTNLSNSALKFTDVPDHKVLLTSTYRYNGRLSVMASGSYNSERYSTSYGIKSGAFALANLSAHIKVYHGISIEGGINNVFDKNYTITEGFPEQGRNYFVNLVFNNL
ncbi:iron complex outermembrane recepter protein [Pedobacter sp. ok626]|uniref:TonB-dependent receptor plug domain-containing protein n=1 Tax=Pedobacter sp. ok626 TaxID=1761882 RepID=UPI000891BACD|nr:TonB-dependent receptor [Pedobacter sp. ok626]SDL40873.1 iron complex outermembrane recepter protein [Pedobacter sp. ok626]